MNIWVIIPAYNEEGALKAILQELKDKDLSVLVIDDGSIDNTFKVAKKLADVVIEGKKNFGKGVSLRKGISYLLKHKEFDYVITMDADGQHSLLDLEKFFIEAEKGAYFVVGNRMSNPLGMPMLRIITNRIMSCFISKIIGRKIPDTQCGFRLIKREVLEKTIIEAKKFEIESEILIKAAKMGFSIKSIPIKTIYFKNLQSKINPFIDTIRFFKFIFQMRKGVS